jgi:uncharacterized protein YbbK (DUF523 family)
MQLMGNPQAPRLVTIKAGRDHTGRLLEWADGLLIELEGKGICGFVLKSRSPSCALYDAPVFGPEGGMSGRGPGLFSRALMSGFPLMPVQDGEALADASMRELFIERVMRCQGMRDILTPG